MADDGAEWLAPATGPGRPDAAAAWVPAVRCGRLAPPHSSNFDRNRRHDDVNPWSICAGMPQHFVTFDAVILFPIDAPTDLVRNAKLTFDYDVFIVTLLVIALLGLKRKS